MLRSNKTNILSYIILIAMAISPAIALGDGNRNLALIGVMYLSPLILLRYMQVYPKDINLALFCGSILLFPLFFNPESIRWSTTLYTVMFCLTFMAYNRLLINKKLSVDYYFKLLKYLIYAYAVTLLIQQFCVLMGLPIFNISNYDPLTPWKLNSLTSEPSHSVRIVTVLMYSYISIREYTTKSQYKIKSDIGKDKLVWIAFLWVMLTSFSATAFLCLGILFCKFFKLKNLIPLTFIAVIIIAFVGLTDSTQIDRASKVAFATLTLNEEAIVEADHSGSARIVPMIICAKMINLKTIDGWFGRGNDYVSMHMYRLFPGVREGYTGGGIFLIAVEYGVIAFVLLLIFSFRAVVNRCDLTTLLFWIFMCLNEGVNMQLTWVCILFLYTNKFLMTHPKQVDI